MAFGFPAYAREERQYGSDRDRLREAVRDVLEILGWAFQEEGVGHYLAKRSMGLASYGERVEIRVTPDGGVTVHSRCVWPLQCIDWGKNQQNVDEFMRQLDRLLR